MILRIDDEADIDSFMNILKSIFLVKQVLFLVTPATVSEDLTDAEIGAEVQEIDEEDDFIEEIDPKILKCSETLQMLQNLRLLCFNEQLSHEYHDTPGFQSLLICKDLQDFFCRVLQRSLH